MLYELPHDPPRTTLGGNGGALTDDLPFGSVDTGDDGPTGQTWAGRQVYDGDIRLTLPTGERLLAERVEAVYPSRDLGGGRRGWHYRIASEDGYLSREALSDRLVDLLSEEDAS